VFSATINPTSEGYLKDPTGARRFWPVACVDMVDRAGLERDRDQLWAESVHRYKAGNPWHLETPELEALATVEQSARFKSDAWEEPIRAWLADRTDVSVWETLEGALGLRFPDREDCPQATLNRVVKILTGRRLGFQQYRARADTPGGRQVRYRREPRASENSATAESLTTLTTPTTTPTRPKIRKTRKTRRTQR
jgi:predicted P-loop ATPase